MHIRRIHNVFKGTLNKEKYVGCGGCEKECVPLEMDRGTTPCTVRSASKQQPDTKTLDKTVGTAVSFQQQNPVHVMLIPTSTTTAQEQRP